MDVFGSTPARKLNKLVEDANYNFETKLSEHATLIDENSEKIKNIILIGQELRDKIKLLETACARIESSASEIEREYEGYIINEIRLQLQQISSDTENRISLLEQNERTIIRQQRDQ